MTTASPSEFLTFMRYAVVRSSVRRQAIHPRPRASIPSLAASRPLHSSSRLFASDKFASDKDTDHATRKSDQKDVQSEGVGKAQKSRAEGGTDTTTSQKDTSGSAAKAKQEHPEAPDTIGMQDERGDRGAYSG